MVPVPVLTPRLSSLWLGLVTPVYARVGRKLVEGVREAGGIWTLEDLANYRVVERDPIRTRFGGYELVTAPPPSSGGIAIAADTLGIGNVGVAVGGAGSGGATTGT